MFDIKNNKIVLDTKEFYTPVRKTKYTNKKLTKITKQYTVINMPRMDR